MKLNLKLFLLCSKSCIKFIILPYFQYIYIFLVSESELLDLDLNKKEIDFF